VLIYINSRFSPDNCYGLFRARGGCFGACEGLWGLMAICGGLGRVFGTFFATLCVGSPDFGHGVYSNRGVGYG